MAARIQNATSQPDVTAGVQHLFKAVYAGGVPAQTLELVHLRASQINGCSICVDIHSRELRIAGEPDERIFSSRRGARRRTTPSRSGPRWR